MYGARDEGITIAITHTLVAKHSPENVCPLSDKAVRQWKTFSGDCFSNSVLCDRYGDTFCAPAATTHGLTLLQIVPCTTAGCLSLGRASKTLRVSSVASLSRCVKPPLLMPAWQSLSGLIAQICAVPRLLLAAIAAPAQNNAYILSQQPIGMQLKNYVKPVSFRPCSSCRPARCKLRR